MKKIAAITLSVLVLTSLVGCSDSSKDKEIADLKQQVEYLQSQLNGKDPAISSSVSSQQQTESAQEPDSTSSKERFDKVTIKLTKKGTKPKDSDNWQFSSYVTFEFNVQNNYEKEIKGIQGIAHFNDMFGKKIISIEADFTDSIRPNSSVIIDDLSLEVNEFKDDHMKLYSTEYNNLEFEYEISKIVFTDGTVLPVE